MALDDKKDVRNNSMDMFRYLCALMVVAIHTSLFEDINSQLGFIFVEIIPRIAVPYFFALSGYFYFQSMLKDGTTWKYIKKIILTYVIWSIIYFIVNFIQWGHHNLKDYIVSSVYLFFVEGSYYHFWFFPALIYSCCISMIIYRTIGYKALIFLSIILYMIGCLGCSYYSLGIKIPILSSLYLSSNFTLIRKIFLMGFPFFVSGKVVICIRDRFKICTSNKIFLIWIISIIIWIMEILLVINANLQSNIILTLGLYLMLVCTLLTFLQIPLSKCNHLAKIARKLATITYYSHPLCILIIELIAENICKIKLNSVVLFVLTIISTLIIGSIMINLFYQIKRKNFKRNISCRIILAIIGYLSLAIAIILSAYLSKYELIGSSYTITSHVLPMFKSILTWFYCLSLWQGVLLVGIALGGFSLARWRFRHAGGWKAAMGGVLVVWLAVIAAATLTDRTASAVAQAPQLIPFQSYRAFFAGENEELLRSNLMNVLLFFPAGLFAGALLPRQRLLPILGIALAAALLSAGIEVLQFRFALGFAETDDVIHNTLGALLGAAAGSFPLPPRRSRP